MSSAKKTKTPTKLKPKPNKPTKPTVKAAAPGKSKPSTPKPKQAVASTPAKTAKQGKTTTPTAVDIGTLMFDVQRVSQLAHELFMDNLPAVAASVTPTQFVTMHAIVKAGHPLNLTTIRQFTGCDRSTQSDVATRMAEKLVPPLLTLTRGTAKGDKRHVMADLTAHGHKLYNAAKIAAAKTNEALSKHNCATQASTWLNSVIDAYAGTPELPVTTTVPASKDATSNDHHSNATEEAEANASNPGTSDSPFVGDDASASA